MERSAVRLLVLALCLIGLATAARAERRVALLIGNAAYREAALRNPVDDVAAMKATLTAAGFDAVIARTDLDRTGMLKALRSFEDAVAGADIGVVFYSGHGIEFRGQNYLLPVDAHLDTDRDVEDQAVNLDRVLDSLSGATKLKLVLLDACRSNPFVDSVRRVATKGIASKGLAPVEASTADTLIAYAAAPGHVALDGDGAQSPFTTALVRHLTTPGLDVELALRRVRDDVVTATNHAQVPFKTGSIGGDEILLGRAAGGPKLPPPPAAVPPAAPAKPTESAMLHPPKLDASPSLDPPLSAKPTLVATFGEWGTYEAQGPRGKVCYALAEPHARMPTSLRRGAGFIFVSTRPDDHVRNEVSVMTGMVLRDGEDVAHAEVGSADFSLITKGQNMWLKDQSEESQFVRTLQTGGSGRLVIKAATLAGEAATDVYLLKGFAQALERATRDCP